MRQVVIPGFNDTDEYMMELKTYIKSNIPNVIRVELLPFHKLGSHKYKKLGIVDPLESLNAMDQDKTNDLWNKYFKEL